MWLRETRHHRRAPPLVGHVTAVHSLERAALTLTFAAHSNLQFRCGPGAAHQVEAATTTQQWGVALPHYHRRRQFSPVHDPVQIPAVVRVHRHRHRDDSGRVVTTSRLAAFRGSVSNVAAHVNNQAAGRRSRIVATPQGLYPSARAARAPRLPQAQGPHDRRGRQTCHVPSTQPSFASIDRGPAMARSLSRFRSEAQGSSKQPERRWRSILGPRPIGCFEREDAHRSLQTRSLTGCTRGTRGSVRSSMSSSTRPRQRRWLKRRTTGSSHSSFAERSNGRTRPSRRLLGFGGMARRTFSIPRRK